ncbi:hypothetical protein AB8810_14230 [Xanthomonas sp. NCPPB 3005]|uniref:hypothetical protein n=1 Tax=Xanthomonas sp. NCPPB 3005 TaxID=3240913 RepID=UPI0035188B00
MDRSTALPQGPKRHRWAALATLLLPLLLALSLPSQAAAGDALKVAVYRGKAGCRGCSEMVVKSLQGSGLDLELAYVGEREPLKVNARTLSGFDLYIQPGGGQDIPAAYAAIGDDGASAIRAFVRSGKGFLGLCMGAYLADRDWIGLVDVALQSEVGRPGSGIDDEGDHTVDVRWDGTLERFYYQDGPYFTGKTASGYAPIAHYRNGDVAMARYGYGAGTVLLTGPHPEADASWMDEEGGDAAAQDKMRRLLRYFAATRTAVVR